MGTSGGGRRTDRVAANDNDAAVVRVRSAVLTMVRLLGCQIAREQFERQAAANDSASTEARGTLQSPEAAHDHDRTGVRPDHAGSRLPSVPAQLGLRTCPSPPKMWTRSLFNRTWTVSPARSGRSGDVLMVRGTWEASC